MHYVEDTAIPDKTPPPAPTDLSVEGNKLTWNAKADFETGIAHFIVIRDGEEIATVPENAKNPHGRPVFQGLQIQRHSCNTSRGNGVYRQVSGGREHLRIPHRFSEYGRIAVPIAEPRESSGRFILNGRKISHLPLQPFTPVPASACSRRRGSGDVLTDPQSSLYWH